MIKKLLFFFVLVLCSTTLFSQSISYFNGNKIETGKIIFKYKSLPTLKSATTTEFEPNDQQANLYLAQIGATTPQQKFPKSITPKNCENCVDISQIYECSYTGDIPFEKVLATLNHMNTIEYAEPSYIGELLYTPNDPEYTNGNLWHLNVCKVLDAWDIEQGDSTVVIGIIDAGNDIIQTDLINKIAYNLKDPIDGYDNDGDGFIDNYRGWDVADNDQDPTNSSATEHGTYVAGIASAQVSNGFGTAGVGFKTKFLPVKVCRDGSTSITNGYDGIVYAANHRCKVINCSWGDVAGSIYGQDIVNYATNNCDALIVAAAGNSASTDMYYPASYKSVLSVGGTVYGDYIWADSPTKGSHYNYYVDICAPAKGFYSIANNDKTISMSGGGTSFASPIVAGAAALVRSKHPEYSAIQVGELLRVTADNIYTINTDPIYKDKLGNGRVNVLKAVTNATLPSIRITDLKTENLTGQPHIYAGDTVALYVTFKNYLHDAKSLIINATSLTSYLSPVKGVFSFSKLEMGKDTTCKFLFVAAAEPPKDLTNYFEFTYTGDNAYWSYEYYPITLNVSYYDFELGDIKSTATGDGSIAIYTVNKNQNGFNYKNQGNCVFQGGLVIAENQSAIYSRSDRKASFEPITSPTIIPTDTADLMIYSQYEAENIPINQYIYGKKDTAAIIYEYRINNQRDSTLYDLRCGAFIDWDILNSSYNKIWYVDSLQLSVAASVEDRTYYVGYMSLDYHPFDVYAFDVYSDVIVYSDGFSNNELWYALNNSKHAIGMNTIYGKEIGVFAHSTIDSIAPSDSCVVRYAMLAADTQSNLYKLAYQLKQKYNPTIVDTTGQGNVAIQTIDYTPAKLCYANNEYWIEYPQSQSNVAIKVFDAQGRLLESVVLSPNNQSKIYSFKKYPKGVYISTFSTNGKTQTFKFGAK